MLKANCIWSAGLCAGALLLAAKSAQAQTSQGVVTSLAACKAIPDPAQRLVCYDRAATTLEHAIVQKSIVVLDREDVKKTRRSLFGFSLPRLPFFGDDDRSLENQEIISTIAAVRPSGYGKWRITLDDGAVWRTTEASRAGLDPHAGLSVKIRRGSLGSYIMNIAGGRGIQAVREN